MDARMRCGCALQCVRVLFCLCTGGIPAILYVLYFAQFIRAARLALRALRCLVLRSMRAPYLS